GQLLTTIGGDAVVGEAPRNAAEVCGVFGVAGPSLDALEGPAAAGWDAPAPRLPAVVRVARGAGAPSDVRGEPPGPCVAGGPGTPGLLPGLLGVRGVVCCAAHGVVQGSGPRSSVADPVTQLPPGPARRRFARASTPGGRRLAAQR